MKQTAIVAKVEEMVMPQPEFLMGVFLGIALYSVI
jgi:hypothetical protein